MQSFLDIVFSLPTAIFTTMLLVSIGYWLIAVLFGLDDGSMDVDGGLDVDGGVEVDSGADLGDSSSDASGGLGALFQMFDLHLMPLTIVITLVSLASWFASLVTISLLTDGDQPGVFVSVAVGIGAFVFGIIVTGRVGRVIGPLFTPAVPIRRRDLIGRICVVRTGRVDRSFGQAEVVDAEQATHTIQIRCETANSLSTGNHALIVDVDGEGRFVVSPDVDSLL